MLKDRQRDKMYPDYRDQDAETDDRIFDTDVDLDIVPRGWDSPHGEGESEDPIDAPHYPAWCDDEDDRCALGPRFQGSHPSMEAPDWREPSAPGISAEQYSCAPSTNRERAVRDANSGPKRHPRQGPDEEQALARGRDTKEQKVPAGNPTDAAEGDRYVSIQASARSVGGQGSKGSGAKRESKSKREERESVPAKENLGGRAQSHGGGRTTQHPREEENYPRQ